MQIRIAETDLVDLHTHSVANDGRWRAATLAKAAVRAGIRVVALTDHDTMAGVAEFAREAAAAGICAVPGVEVSCWWQGEIFHVLLYGVDSHNEELTQLLADLWAELVAVAESAHQELRRRGHELPQLDQVRGGGDLLPYHVMVAALRAGIGPTFTDVVRVLVKEMGISFAAGADMAAAVAAGHAAGGVAVLAHPGRGEFGFTAADPLTIDKMVAATGLDGVEVYHWSHGPAEVATYGQFAAERGLLVGGGSDSHGPHSAHPLRGWEARLCRDLLERCGVGVIGTGGRVQAESDR